MFCRFTGPIRQVREPSPLKVFCCRVVFYGSSTLLSSFRARSVNLTTLFPCKPPSSLPVLLVHILSPVTDNCPFLNQRKGDNGRRIFFMTILLPRVCAGREDGIRDRPHTRWTRVRPSYHARQRNLKVGELFIQPCGLPSQRSKSSVRYLLKAIFKSLTQTASRCTESCIIIQQSS